MREAMAWARLHAPGLAVDLSWRAAIRATFSPWRGQTFAWLRSFEPLMRSAQAEGFDLELRVLWWNELARNALMSMSEDAQEVAQQALALARTLGTPRLLFAATVVFVRVTRALGPEIDEACAEIVRLDAAHPEWPPRMRLMGLGTLAMIAERRGDYEGELAVRREELAVARRVGLQTSADAAETNIVCALSKLGRHEEALDISRAIVLRLEGRHSANVAWAWDGLVTALLNLGRLEEACASLRSAEAACAEFDLPICTPLMARLALLRRRPDAAATLLGHALQAFESRGMGTDEIAQIVAQVTAEAQQLLGAAAVESLVQQGRGLDPAQALELACRG
jgi:tetratricopeptide (TPR) repeat protein